MSCATESQVSRGKRCDNTIRISDFLNLETMNLEYKKYL